MKRWARRCPSRLVITVRAVNTDRREVPRRHVSLDAQRMRWLGRRIDDSTIRPGDVQELVSRHGKYIPEVIGGCFSGLNNDISIIGAQLFSNLQDSTKEDILCALPPYALHRFPCSLLKKEQRMPWFLALSLFSASDQRDVLDLAHQITAGPPGATAKMIDAFMDRFSDDSVCIGKMADVLVRRGLWIDAAAVLAAARGLSKTQIINRSDSKGLVEIGFWELALRRCEERDTIHVVEDLIGEGNVFAATSVLSVNPPLIRALSESHRGTYLLLLSKMHRHEPRANIDFVLRHIGAAEGEHKSLLFFSALSASGHWQKNLLLCADCDSPSKVGVLLAGATRGGAPFSVLQKVVEVEAERRPEVSKNEWREILIQCALEAGEWVDAMKTFTRAHHYGSKSDILDHATLVGKVDMPFSVQSLLSAGLWENALRRATSELERHLVEDFIVRNHPHPPTFVSSSPMVGLRLIFRLAMSDRWQNALAIALPEVCLSRVTRQWTSFYLAQALSRSTSTSIAFQYLVSSANISSAQAALLLFTANATSSTFATVIQTSWQNALFALTMTKKKLQFSMEAVVDLAIRHRDCGRPSNLVVFLEHNLPGRRTSANKQATLVVDVVKTQFLGSRSADWAQALLSASPSQHDWLGSIAPASVAHVWSQHMCSHVVTSDFVSSWISMCAKHENWCTALEVLRLCGVVRVTPSVESILEIVPLIDFSAASGHTLMSLARTLPSFSTLVRIACSAMCSQMPDRVSVAQLVKTFGDEQKRAQIQLTDEVVRALVRATTGGLGGFSIIFNANDVSILCHSNPKWSFRSGSEAVRWLVYRLYTSRHHDQWSLAVRLVTTVGIARARPSTINQLITLIVFGCKDPHVVHSIASAVGAPSLSSSQALLSCALCAGGAWVDALRLATRPSPEVSVARAMAMSMSAQYASLAWISIDTMSIEHVFRKPPRFPSQIVRWICEAKLGKDPHYSWIVHPPSSVLTVGRRAGQWDLAIQLVDHFSRKERPRVSIHS